MKEYSDMLNGIKVTKENQHGCQKCKYNAICLYCGLDLRGFTREHSEKCLSPYDVLVLGATERYAYEPETKSLRVPLRFVKEFEEIINSYYVSTMSEHLKSLNIDHKVFVLYPDNKDVEKRKDIASKYINNMLSKKGYTTHEQHCKVGHNTIADKDCIEVLVIGDFNDVESFIGNVQL